MDNANSTQKHTTQSNYSAVVHSDQECGNGEVEMKGLRTQSLCTEDAQQENASLRKKLKDKDLNVKYNEPYRKCKRRTCLEKYLFILCLLLFIACITLIIIAIFSSSKQHNQTENSGLCTTSQCVRTAAHLLSAMDAQVDPCDDFYQYACGTWNNRHIIPEDKSTLDIFEELHGQLEIKIRRLLETPQNKYDTGATLKAKTLYRSCTNKSAIERKDAAQLMSLLQSQRGMPALTANWNDSEWHLEKMLAQFMRFNSPILVDIWVAIDDKNSSANVLKLDQPSLGMPSREYYLPSAEQKYKNAYLDYMIEMAKILGASEETAVADMTKAFEFETQLAEIMTPQNERHDTGALYRKLTIADLAQEVPGFNWLLYFNEFMPMQITYEEPVVCFALDYLRGVTGLINQTDKRVLANYLLWRLILGFAPELSEKFQHVRHNYRKVLQGVSQDTPRWQKCVVLANERMGMAVGRMFIRENFDEESKDTALEMIENIKAAFVDILEYNDWMDEETKAVAKEKANAMYERIGYPDFILDNNELELTYYGLEFDEDDYFENILNLERFDSLENLKKLRIPIDKDKWEQAPAVFNAFYNPNTNDIVFPAGILQPLFYDKHSPKSLNYGGIGVVIGHEITHGFDDRGRQYDKEGNLRQWWNNETITAFRDRAQCIIDQYSEATLYPFGLPIDGKNTQGENIADNGGLKEAFKAYKKWVAQNGEEPLLPGINHTHDQLFFLNYAQIWCGLMRQEEAVHIVRTSVHSPGPIRVQLPLSNSEDFARAYNCPLGSRMNPVKKCSVW